MAEQDMVDVLRSDHRALQRLVSDALGSGNSAHLQDTVEQLVTETVRHLSAETQYLHPLLRDVLDDGGEVTATQHRADRDLEDLLRRLERVEAQPAAAAEVLAQIATAIGTHVEAQETLFPRLRQDVTATWLVDMGDQILGAEQMAPERPHRLAPENPTLAKLTALAQGYVDHLRDASRRHETGEQE